MLINASSRDDILRLATLIRGIEGEDRCQFAAVITDLGLMKVKHAQVTGAIEMLKSVRGKRGLIDFFTFLFVIEPNALEEFIEDTIDHILNGVDSEDIDSVGGWSQREVNLLLTNYEFPTVSA